MGNFDFKEGKCFLTFTLKKEQKNGVESYTRKYFIKKHGIYYIKETYKKQIFKPHYSLFNYHINLRRKQFCHVSQLSHLTT